LQVQVEREGVERRKYFAAVLEDIRWDFDME
jgi:hypothetical protein